MSKISLAMYKARGNWVDKIIRLFTGKPYSHCEVAIKIGLSVYQCYSSSPRDGGVRVKTMRLPADKWDLIPVHTDSDIVDFFSVPVAKNTILSGQLVACYRLSKSQVDIIVVSGVMRQFLA